MEPETVLRTRKQGTAVLAAVDQATAGAVLVVRLHLVKATQVEPAAATLVAVVVALALWEATALGITEEPVEPEPLRPLRAVR